MDESKQYLTMIYEAWDDLIELWTPRNTDWVARKGTLDQVLQDFLQEYTDERMIIKSYEDNKVSLYGWRLFGGFDKHELVCALRQDQLQEMLKFDVGSFNDNLWSALSGLNALSFVAKFVAIPMTMEQLWLHNLMYKSFNKTWDGVGWANRENTPPDNNQALVDIISHIYAGECPFCGKPSPDGNPHKDCMDREQYQNDRE